MLYTDYESAYYEDMRIFYHITIGGLRNEKSKERRRKNGG